MPSMISIRSLQAMFLLEKKKDFGAANCGLRLSFSFRLVSYKLFRSLCLFTVPQPIKPPRPTPDDHI